MEDLTPLTNLQQVEQSQTHLVIKLRMLNGFILISYPYIC